MKADFRYGLIGKTLKHSFSKEIHDRLHPECDYRLWELPDTDSFSSFMEKKEFSGLNVTIPYKTDVIPFLDGLTAEARSIGAVNTVYVKDGKYIGDNTDFAGLYALISRNGFEIKGKKCLILGTGGTSKTAHAVLRDMGAATVLKVSRTPSKEGEISYAEATAAHSDAEIIINTTPVGMYPNTDGVPVDLSLFPKLEGYVDVIYNPLRTAAVQSARALNIPAVGGLYMLVAQAVASSERFFGSPVPETETERLFKDILSSKQNIVLIGMPGSGKSTLGSMIASKTQKRFYDTDELIVKKTGMSIPDFFEKFGESEFRKTEAEVIKELSFENGAVISTGGGVVLNENNITNLRKNGLLVFIDRRSENITPTSDRPLSSTREALQKLYTERYPLYKKSSDLTFVPLEDGLESDAQRLISMIDEKRFL